MVVFVNGERTATNKTTLKELQISLFASEEVVTILDGYQTDEDCRLKENMEIIFMKKGVFPSKKEWEHMLYARNSKDVQKKISKARVAIIGLGGLGSHIAIELARCGIGELHIVDYDVVEPSNLNRQAYRMSHLGIPKVEALEQEIKQVNPFVKVTAERKKIDETNIEQVLQRDMIICEAVDNPKTKAMIVNEVLTIYPEKWLVAASGMAGYGKSNEIKTKQITGHFYLCGDGISDAGAGNSLMAPRVGICAGHQANKILEIIIEQ
ncbi:sulfur carrier protein ThiS adenylyltransferase ThiF [Velocimicrobium porci]|uniref:Sulfur carrier protein ThiS adenylyltransferase ThiF n=1 Tax=Velocimicrobium porci TaxID=2606634 RepID=A0A6L5XZY3_9FIRM|nr:sulfur carrier protein ThiS adenylyltransferase ThiF [Velocimicrobium porci]MSS64426.1 sulfur carrier protein ThiS adenylyltransferase ThiF [Velocimicrobium porci]